MEEKSDSQLSEKIRSFYVEILGREPSPTEIKNQIERIKNNQVKLEQIPSIFRNSPEFFKRKIVKPIFIIGMQRGGTTILYNVFSNHNELCWFAANDNEKIFSKTFLEKQKLKLSLERSMGKKPGGELALMFFGEDYTKKSPTWNILKNPERIPVEGVHIWNHYFGRDFNAEVTPKSKEIKNLIESICIEQEKTRFLSKNPESIKRLDAINSIFPDALFVCIIRDPVACVNSRILRVRKEGESFYKSIPTIGASIDEMTDVEFASLNLKQNLEMIFDFKPKVKDRFYFMFYEDLVKDTKNEVKKLLEFLELSIYPEFTNNIPKLANLTQKWKKTLNNDELEVISKTLTESVKKFNLPYNLEKVKN